MYPPCRSAGDQRMLARRSEVGLILIEQPPLPRGGDHRRTRRRVEVELAREPPQMGPHRLVADVEALRDLAVGQVGGEEDQRFLLVLFAATTTAPLIAPCSSRRGR